MLHTINFTVKPDPEGIDKLSLLAGTESELKYI
jgi:hypothetical protein